MDTSSHYDYHDLSSSSDSDSYNDSSDENNLEHYKKKDIENRFQINEGMMYLTSCNINQDIIPITLHGKINGSKQCICYVGGSSTNPGTLILNNMYDIYCDFFSYTSINSLKNYIGSVFIINIDELNCNDINSEMKSTGEGITQCPSKLLIPITNVNDILSTPHKTNTINTDTNYITSINPTKINRLTLSFDLFNMSNNTYTGLDDIFFLKLIFKKMDGNINRFLEEKDKQNITIK